jgi:hypothetical protein
MKIGDKVRFLDEVGGGIVKSFTGKDTVWIEDADGFDIPMLIKDCITIETDDYNMKLKRPEHVTPQAEEPALIFDVVENDVLIKQVYVPAKAIRMAMLQGKVEAEQPKPQPVAKSVNRNGIIEVDLHIDVLLDDTTGMDGHDILDYQLDKFHQTLEQYKGRREQRIVFIHGKGSDGALRRTILDELKRKYSNYYHQDASFQEYGYGATMVTIK